MVAALWLVLISPAVWGQEVPELQITSKYYVVLDADTGEVFAARGMHEPVAMASLTKIFTAIEALERADLSTRITTTASDASFDTASTTMGFGPGETLTLQDLLYGMMLPSGNDAAHAIARELGTLSAQDSDAEAVDRFVGWMNQRVRDMGLTDTNLVNPHGWGVPGHRSSVYDLAAFTRYALQYPTFVELISTPIYTTSNGAYTVTSTNKMLNTYPGILGGKTGYDDDAGYCLIEVARRGGSTMISVTLDGVAPDDWYDDNRVLLDYAFEQKAARAGGPPPAGAQFVTFRDPDAARLAANAESGGSLGSGDGSGFAGAGTRPTAAAVVPAPVDGQGEMTGDQSAGARSSDGQREGRRLLVAVLVAVGVILFRSYASFVARGPAGATPGARTDGPGRPAVPVRSRGKLF